MKSSFEALLLNLRGTGQPDGLNRSAAEDFRLVLTHAGAPRRTEAEQFIARAYRQAFDARLKQFYPCIVTLQDPKERILGAIGVRPASKSPLFCEHYLSGRIEGLIAEQAGPVCRDHVVEIGNLAVDRAARTHLFFSLLGEWLSAGEVQWLAFSLTPSLRRLMTRARVPVLDLGPAAALRAPDDGNDWGRYYDQHPRVCVVPVGLGLQRFRESAGEWNGAPFRTGSISA